METRPELASAKEFFKHIIKHWLWIVMCAVPALLQAPFYFGVQTQSSWMTIMIPLPAGVVILLAAIFVASFMAFHDLRTEGQADSEAIPVADLGVELKEPEFLKRARNELYDLARHIGEQLDAELDPVKDGDAAVTFACGRIGSVVSSSRLHELLQELSQFDVVVQSDSARGRRVVICASPNADRVLKFIAGWIHVRAPDLRAEDVNPSFIEDWHQMLRAATRFLAEHATAIDPPSGAETREQGTPS